MFSPTSDLVRNQSTFAVFVCTVTGFPRPPVNWRRRSLFSSSNRTSQLIQQMTNKVVLRNSVVSDSSGLFTVTSTIAILNLTIEDSQVYMCTGENAFNVTNNLGAQETASISLSVQRKTIIIYRIKYSFFSPQYLHVLQLSLVNLLQLCGVA